MEQKCENYGDMVTYLFNESNNIIRLIESIDISLITKSFRNNVYNVRKAYIDCATALKNFMKEKDPYTFEYSFNDLNFIREAYYNCIENHKYFKSIGLIRTKTMREIVDEYNDVYKLVHGVILNNLNNSRHPLFMKFINIPGLYKTTKFNKYIIKNKDKIVRLNTKEDYINIQLYINEYKIIYFRLTGKHI